MPLTKLKKRLTNHFVLDGCASKINCVHSFERNPAMFVSDFITADDGSVRKIVELSQLDESEYVTDELRYPRKSLLNPIQISDWMRILRMWFRSRWNLAACYSR